MEEEIKTPKPKGGYREGSGRKPKTETAGQVVSVNIPKHYLQLIKENFPNRSDFIQHAIREKLRREGLL